MVSNYVDNTFAFNIAKMSGLDAYLSCSNTVIKIDRFYKLYFYPLLRTYQKRITLNIF